MKRVYLDHAATTPLDQRVNDAMAPFWISEFGNASGLYEEGRRAKEALGASRIKIAKLIGAHADEIIFTSGGTESDNLAIFGASCGMNNLFSSRLNPRGIQRISHLPASGVVSGRRIAGSDADSENELFVPHIITTKFEHHAVLHPCQELEKRGWEVTYLDVGKDGIVDPKDVKKALRPETVLVSIMHANNEIGTIQPIREIGKIIREFKSARAQVLKDLASATGASTRNFSAEKYPCLSKLRAETMSFGQNYPLFHTDACQSAGYLDLNVNPPAGGLGVDLMTINGSKIYGPKGVGLLYVRRGTKISPQILGGGQEMGLRAGTEPIALIAGLAKALEIAQGERERESARLTELRNYFIEKIGKKLPQAVLNGHPVKRLPNNINISIPGASGEEMVIRLDARGISCSTGSACSSESAEPSHALLAIGLSPELANSSLRLTMGRSTTKKDLDFVLEKLSDIINQYGKRN